MHMIYTLTALSSAFEVKNFGLVESTAEPLNSGPNSDGKFHNGGLILGLLMSSQLYFYTKKNNSHDVLRSLLHDILFICLKPNGQQPNFVICTFLINPCTQTNSAIPFKYDYRARCSMDQE